LHRISWDPYNEDDDLIAQAEKYKSENGCYPERICADRIYINTKNRRFCTRAGIRLSGKRLGRPPKDQKRNAEHKQQLLADQRKRNEVEGVFGTGKRINSLNLIMAKLKAGAEGTISLSFLVMCAVKILRLLRLIYGFIRKPTYRRSWGRRHRASTQDPDSLASLFRQPLIISSLFERFICIYKIDSAISFFIISSPYSPFVCHMLPDKKCFFVEICMSHRSVSGGRMNEYGNSMFLKDSSLSCLSL
jgi:hypothetical protein